MTKKEKEAKVEDLEIVKVVRQLEELAEMSSRINDLVEPYDSLTDTTYEIGDLTVDETITFKIDRFVEQNFSVKDGKIKYRVREQPTDVEYWRDRLTFRGIGLDFKLVFHKVGPRRVSLPTIIHLAIMQKEARLLDILLEKVKEKEKELRDTVEILREVAILVEMVLEGKMERSRKEVVK